MKMLSLFLQGFQKAPMFSLTNHIHLRTGCSYVLLSILLLLAGGCFRQSGPIAGLNVSLEVSKKELHQGQTSVASATVKRRSNNRPIVGHRMNYSLSVTTAGTLNRATAPTDQTGVATSTFTAGKVNEDTPVWVTAKATNGSGDNDRKKIIVKPPIIFGDWGGDGPGIAIGNADILIFPSVEKIDDSEYKFTYVVTVNAALNPPPTSMNRLTLIFQVPMESVTADQGTLVQANEGRINTVTFGVSGATTETIIAECKDCDTGGVASFTIADAPLPAPGNLPTANLVGKSVIGPKAPPP